MTNLPMAVPFINRDAEARSIIDRIINGDAPGLLLKGPGGMGKSALAFHVANLIAHSCETARANRPFDGIFQISAKAVPVTVGSFADALGRFVGYPAVASQPSTEEKIEAVYRILAELRLLIIVDNLETVHDSGFLDSLFRLPQSCKLLLTSRIATSHDRPLQVFELRPLSHSDSLALLRREFDRLHLPDISRSSHEGLERMLKLSGGSPLGIKWAAGRMGQGASVDSVVARLRSAEADLFETAFADSWRSLDESARWALMALSTLGTSADRSVVADALGGPPGADPEEAVSALVAASLFEAQRSEEPVRTVRYSLHPLTRVYARNQLAGYPEREQVHLGVARSLLKFITARRNYQLGRAEHEYLETELPNAIQTIEWLADECGRDATAAKLDLLVTLADAIAVYLWSRGYWAERNTICKRVFEAARAQGRHVDAGRHAAFISQVLVWQGDIARAREWSKRATAEMESGSPLDRAIADRIEALLLHRQGDTATAVTRMEAVLAAIRTADTGSAPVRETIRSFADWACRGAEGYRAGEVAVAQEIGIMYADIGDRDAAISWLDVSLQLANQIGDVEASAVSLSHKGRAFGLAEPVAGRACFEEGLSLAEDVGRRSTEGRCLLGLAQLALHDRHFVRAEMLGNQAAGIFSRLGMRPEETSSLSVAVTAREIRAARGVPGAVRFLARKYCRYRRFRPRGS